MSLVNMLIDAAMLFSLVMCIETIKKYQKPEVVKKWKSRQAYVTLFIVLCIPLACVSSMMNDVFNKDTNSVLVMIGTTFRTFFIMAAAGAFSYDAILKKALKEKEELSE